MKRNRKPESFCTDRAPEAIGPYSQAMLMGGVICTSGQIPIDPSSGEVSGENITEQTEQVIFNLKAILEAAGSGLDKTVKTTCFLRDMSVFPEFNRVYGKYFTQKPARSCVAVSGLPKNVMVEIEAIAVL